MFGAILGDIIGSPYEFDRGRKVKDFPLFRESSMFTDDTVMTIAVAEAFMEAGQGLTDEEIKALLISNMRRWGRKYPYAGYGMRFSIWLAEPRPKPYGSYGNGSAMRVSSVAWLFDDLETVRKMARLSADVTHNHPEGIKGAQATAAAIFMARTGNSKEEIRRFITDAFGYDLNRSCDDIRPTYGFDGSCQGTVPESIIAFLDSKDYEDALRLCISLGGDADTMGDITGAIAGAYYNKMPYALYNFGMEKLPKDIQNIVGLFNSEHGHSVSCRWRNAEFDTEELIRKVKSGKIFI